MARIEGIAEQAERDRELKRTELETDKESKLSSETELSFLNTELRQKNPGPKDGTDRWSSNNEYPIVTV